MRLIVFICSIIGFVSCSQLTPKRDIASVDPSQFHSIIGCKGVASILVNEDVYVAELKKCSHMINKSRFIEPYEYGKFTKTNLSFTFRSNPQGNKISKKEKNELNTIGMRYMDIINMAYAKNSEIIFHLKDGEVLEDGIPGSDDERGGLTASSITSLVIGDNNFSDQEKATRGEY